MKSCGIESIDKSNKQLIKEANLALKSGNKDDLKIILDKIQEFRYKLAYTKSTELLESNFGWTKEYDKLNAKINKLL